MVKYILVLGGSNFMGKSLLSKLYKFNEYEVHYINRGKQHWNNEVKSIPNLKYTYGDREDKYDFTKLLIYLSEKLEIGSGLNEKKWECVIDFSGFNYKEIRSVYNALHGKINLYIFISTDSIYDVCDPKIRNNELNVEEYDERPTINDLKLKLARKDTYGHKKLKCEEYLKKVINQKEFPFIILRLPDVIGPYDDSGRYWFYVKLIDELKDTKIELDSDSVKKKMSFVYSEDVSNFIINLISKIETNELNEKTLNQSFNIAFQEIVTLEELLKYMAADLKAEKLYQYIDDEIYSRYPSVECGPLDITKAKTILNWNPTTLIQAIHETNEFYIKNKGVYREEEIVYNKIKSKLRINKN